jgi:hypothetical protein
MTRISELGTTEYRPGIPYSIPQFFHPHHKNQIYGHIAKEAIEIELHPYDKNREVSFVSVNLGSLLPAP